MTGAPKIFVVDDDESVRDSLDALLSAEGFQVQTFGSGREFVEKCDPREHGCLLLDVNMPEMDGLTLQKKVAEGWPRLAVVIVTGHADVPIAVRAMKAGAVDFIEKPFERPVLLDTVRQALARAAEAAAQAEEASTSQERLSSLSTRERQVLEGLVAGLPNKTIAYDLQISPRTVEIYRARLMDKMQAGSLSELVRLAVLAGVRTR